MRGWPATPTRWSARPDHPGTAGFQLSCPWRRTPRLAACPATRRWPPRAAPRNGTPRRPEHLRFPAVWGLCSPSVSQRPVRPACCRPPSTQRRTRAVTLVITPSRMPQAEAIHAEWRLIRALVQFSQDKEAACADLLSSQGRAELRRQISRAHQHGMTTSEEVSVDVVTAWMLGPDVDTRHGAYREFLTAPQLTPAQKANALKRITVALDLACSSSRHPSARQPAATPSAQGH